MYERKESRIAVILSVVCAIALCSCATQPAIVIDTTPVDTVILDVADTAGNIESQVITIHDTVTKIIYEARPEDKAKIEKQFSDLYASISHLKALPNELMRVHAIEVGKLSSEIARLKPFEVETEKQKAAKWRAYSILGIIAAVATCYVLLKVFKRL